MIKRPGAFKSDFEISYQNPKFQNSDDFFETATIFVTDPLDQPLPENQYFEAQICRFRPSRDRQNPCP